MKKGITLVLAFALTLSIDCKELMNNTNVICPLQKKSLEQSPCHSKNQNKENTKQKCNCETSKNISVEQEIKNPIRITLIAHSPRNFSFEPIHHYKTNQIIDIRKLLSENPNLSNLKTIHLLI